MSDLTLIYEQSWSTYEEWGGIRIYEDGHGALYCQHGGYSVMGGYDDPEWAEPEICSYEQACELIDEWEALCAESEKDMEGSWF